MTVFTFSKKNTMLFCSLVMGSMLSAQTQNTSYNANTIPINGSYSTSFGINTLHVNTGSGNTANGHSALYSNTSGSYNTATGRAALYVNTTGTCNTAHGYYALFANSTGSNNTALGHFSLLWNTTGSNNTASGYQSLYTNTIGANNTANGYQALYNNTKGNGNAAVGYQAMYSDTTGEFNAALGYQALYYNTGHDNTANGYQALFYNTLAVDNSALGYQALYHNTTGFANTALGSHTLYSNIGEYNTGVGAFAMDRNTTGGVNTAVGYQALYSNTSANFNSAFGESTLYNNTTGGFNVGIGNAALLNNTTGANNTASGFRALASNFTGSYNSAMGWGADVSTDGLSNATAIGYNAVVDASNKVRIGNTSVTSIGGQVGWTIYSDSRVKKNIKEGVPGLAFISLLKPVMYNYDAAKENELLGNKTQRSGLTNNADMEKITFSGFLAQAVDSAAQKIGYNFSGIDKTGAIMGLRYSDFIMPVVKAIQEQQQQIDELKKLLSAKATINIETYDLSSKNASLLEQNTPNPFSGQTNISYTIPENAGKAALVFYDSAGRLIGSHSITARGKGLLTLTSGSLSAGIYSYTLIIDGKIIDSKKLTRL